MDTANRKKEDVSKTLVKEPVKVGGKAPSTADKGARDSISHAKQQHQGMPSADELRGEWKQLVGTARVAWGKLTRDELLQSKGHVEKLAGLVQERYAISRDAAEKPVNKFIYQHKS